MANKNNATCSICGKEYYACLSCRDSIQLAPWKSFTDTPECYKVFQAVRGYSTGVYNEDEFKSRLQNIDLSDLENYKDNIKVIIKNALKKETIVEDIEETVVEKPVVIRKRNYKAKNEAEVAE